MWFSYSWAEEKASRKAAFRNRSITVDPKSPTVLIGRNGSGKTLAQHILATFTSLLRATGGLRDGLLADLSALGLERVETQFELELIRHHPPGIGYEQDGQGNLMKGKYPIDLLWDFNERWGSPGHWDGSEFSFPMDTRDGCWRIEEGEVRADCTASLLVTDLQNQPHVHLKLVVSSKNQFTIMPDSDGIQKFWGIGHQPNIMSDDEAMLQPQEVLALGDSESFELTRTLNHIPDDCPITWLFECEEFVDLLRTATRNSLETAKTKADSAFKNLIESWIGPAPTEVDYHPFSDDEDAFVSESAMPWDYFWTLWLWADPWTYHESVGDEKKPFEAFALDAEFPGHVMLTTRDWLIWSIQRTIPVVVPMDVTREVPRVSQLTLDLLEQMVKTHRKLINYDLNEDVVGVLESQFTSTKPLLSVFWNNPAYLTYSQLINQALGGEDGVQSSDFDPSAWMGDAYPDIRTDTDSQVRRMKFWDSVGNVEAWFDSGILFSPIETDTSGARQIICELYANLPMFTGLNEISSCDSIIDVIEGVLNCRSYIDPILRMHHEEMTRHSPPHSQIDMESRRPYLECFITGWMLHEYAKRISDQHLNMLYLVYLRLFHRFSTRDSVNEQTLVNDDWSEFLLILDQPETMPSGYRNLLALAEGVIKKDEQARIFFVDEPEISLHVDWQQGIVGLLQEIVQYTNPYSMLVIATHSPEVIMNHMDNIIEFSNRLEA